jgi:hypothetical protein
LAKIILPDKINKVLNDCKEKGSQTWKYSSLLTGQNFYHLSFARYLDKKSFSYKEETVDVSSLFFLRKNNLPDFFHKVLHSL